MQTDHPDNKHFSSIVQTNGFIDLSTYGFCRPQHRSLLLFTFAYMLFRRCRKEGKRWVLKQRLEKLRVSDCEKIKHPS